MGALPFFVELMNVASQRATNSANIQNQKDLQLDQQQFVREQNNSLYPTYRKSLESAGLNINSMFGGYPNTSAPSVPAPAPQSAPQFDLQSLLVDSQIQTSNAEIRKLNADARAQEIENARQESQDKYFNKFILDEFADNLPDGNNVLSDVSISGNSHLYNKGTFDARRAVREWLSEQKRLSVNDVRNSLDELVTSSQMSDSRIVQALQEMPYQSYRQLCELVTNLSKEREVMDSVINLNNSSADYNDAQRDFVNLQKKLQEDNSIMSYIDKYIPEGGLRDFTKFVVILLSSLKGLPLGFHTTNSTTTVNSSHVTNSSHTHNSSGTKIYNRN